MTGAEVTPEVTLVFEHRKAESNCCGAGLGILPGGRHYCQECGEPCQRILSDPVEVTARG